MQYISCKMWFNFYCDLVLNTVYGFLSKKTFKENRKVYLKLNKKRQLLEKSQLIVCQIL